MTNPILVCWFLDIQIQCEENSTCISLDQKAFIITILKLFNMQNTHNVSTAMAPTVTLDLAKDLGENDPKDSNGYNALVSWLIYPAVASRPNISFAVAALSG